MSDELARLEIKVDSISATLADQRLGNLTRTSRRAERATDGLMKSFAGAAVAILSVQTAIDGLRGLVEITSSFQNMEARLITATGSIEGAAIAMQSIKDLALETPYDLEQVTNGFIRLANLGLSPSERALISYGNTASATGKTMNQFIEAVADAATYEFERLKEFGIKANQMGDQVSFTFRGITTVVQRSAKNVTDYLTALGENEFAGEMERRMDTMSGAISNMQDQWRIAVNNISKTGIGDAIEDGFRQTTGLLEEFNNYAESGALDVLFDAFAERFTQFKKAGEGSIDFVTDLWLSAPEAWRDNITNVIDAIIEYWKTLPENIVYIVKRIGIEFSYLVAATKEHSRAFVDDWVVSFEHIAARAELYRQDIASSLNPFADKEFDLSSQLLIVDKAFARQRARLRANTTEIEKDRQASIDAIEKEREVNIGAFNEKVSQAEALVKAYREQQAARKALNKDELAQFGQDGGKPGKTLREIREEENAKKASARKFERLREELMTEEEEIQYSYDRRLQLILDNTQKGSEAQANLKARLDKEFAEAVLGEEDQEVGFDAEMDKLQKQFDRKRDLIMQNTALTAEQREELETKLTKQRLDAVAKLEYAQASTIFKSSQTIFDGLSSIARDFAGEQSGIYKAMFLASKAFAIADSIIKIQQGIANASAMPWPANIGAIASTVAATANIVSTIQSTRMQFAGGFDNGGFIPSGQFGIVGERGPEAIMGPVNIAGRQDTARALREGLSGGGTGGGNVVNIFTDQGLSVREEAGPKGESNVYVTREEFGDMMAGEASDPNSAFNEAQDSLYERRRA